MPSVTLIRHGQASFGQANYDQLSALGFAQAEHLGQVLRAREEPVSAVFMGAMARHRQTAETCLAAAGLDLPITVLPDFNEFNHEQVLARFEPRYRDPAWLRGLLGQADHPATAFADFFGQAVQRWISGEHDADYDESWRAFQARARGALDQALAALDEGQHALVFTSGGCIANIGQALLGLTDSATFRLNLTLANGGLSRVAQGRHGRHLLSLNEHSHYSGRHRHLLTYR